MYKLDSLLSSKSYNLTFVPRSHNLKMKVLGYSSSQKCHYIVVWKNLYTTYMYYKNEIKV